MNSPLATMASLGGVAASLSGFMLAIFSSCAWACFNCREAVEKQVYGPDFISNLTALLLPLIILAMAGALAFYSDAIVDRLKR